MADKKLEYDNVEEGLEEWREALKPCPFCGTECDDLEFEDMGREGWQITCPHCGASNWADDYVGDLVYRWNTRNGVEWFPQDHL